MTYPVVPLGSIAEVKLGRQRSPRHHSGEQMRPYMRAANVGWNGWRLDDVKSMNFTDDEMSVYRLQPGDLLLGEASGSASEVGKPAIWEGQIEDCAFQNTLIRVRPRDADARYLLHYFKYTASSGKFAERSRGVGIFHLGRKALAEWPIPLPKIEEQRRIAAVLDAADALRAKRRQALAKLDTLTQAIFIDMFGELARCEHVRFGTLLTEPLRNGISPAKSGTVVAKVLNLSAITGRAFKASAVKESTFTKPYAFDKTVTSEDFLICRGNGNLGLVGRGNRPTASMRDVAFPDTMIAARCDKDLIAPGYLDHLWGTSLVRRQLEAAARTTNGTHKINQTMIEGVMVPLPAIATQRRFEAASSAIEAERERFRCCADELDVLFASLQQRAFRGEL